MARKLALIDPRRQDEGAADGVVQLLHTHLATLAFEQFVVAGCDGRGRLHSLAEQSGSAQDVAGILAAVRRALAPPAVTHLIIAHNHPCHCTNVSLADRETTRRVAAVGRLGGGGLLGHLVFAGEEIVSFRALGLI